MGYCYLGSLCVFCNKNNDAQAFNLKIDLLNTLLLTV